MEKIGIIWDAVKGFFKENPFVSTVILVIVGLYLFFGVYLLVHVTVAWVKTLRKVK